MDVDVIADCIRRTFSNKRFEKKPSATLSVENSPPYEKEAAGAETPDTVEALVEKESSKAEVPEAMEALELVEAKTPKAVETPIEKESAEAEVLEAIKAPKLVETETPEAVEAPVKKEYAEAEVPEAMEALELVEAETPEAVEAPVEKESAEAEVPEAMEVPKFTEEETPGTVETPNKKEDVRAEAPYEKDSAGTQAPETMEAPYEKEAVEEENSEAMEVLYEKKSAGVEALTTLDEKDFAEAEALATKLAYGKTYLRLALMPTKGFIPFANTMLAKGLMKDRLSIQPSKPLVQDCLGPNASAKKTVFTRVTFDKVSSLNKEKVRQRMVKRELNVGVRIPSPKVSKLEKRKVYKGPKPEAIIAKVKVTNGKYIWTVTTADQITIIPKATWKPSIAKENEK
ncbi:uncharacterized protein LOC127249162 [Andrographis paniculata]|uniref:uncharacterized protein LOC127249162 n=1 Tax=Andrographis paniculata TaxID=175694 RepID=UPI0021E8C106|nr:uncharacterized protein LOC127249162 [Andrographis paniculata]